MVEANSCTYDDQYVGQSIDDSMKRNILTRPWVPPLNYMFPFSKHTKQGKVEKRFASHNHLNRFSWLTFSHEKQGYFCKYSPFFNHNLRGFQKNVHLLTRPLQKYAKIFGNDGR